MLQVGENATSSHLKTKTRDNLVSLLCELKVCTHCHACFILLISMTFLIYLASICVVLKTGPLVSSIFLRSITHALAILDTHNYFARTWAGSSGEPPPSLGSRDTCGSYGKDAEWAGPWRREGIQAGETVGARPQRGDPGDLSSVCLCECVYVCVRCHRHHHHHHHRHYYCHHYSHHPYYETGKVPWRWQYCVAKRSHL